MFIRQTQTNNSVTGERYLTFRLVRGERIGGRVRQITLLNLGRHFPIDRKDWPLLCLRIEQLMQGQTTLLPGDCSEQIEQAAQRYVGQLMARSPGQTDADVTLSQDGAGEAMTQAMCEVDVNSLQLWQPRSVGVEQIGLYALSQLGLVAKLTELGINGVGRAAIIGNIIGRMAKPASERATWQWLQTESGLGELMDVDFNGMSHMSLYRASDSLMRHREAIENHVFSRVQSLFGLQETITLFDLTNTYFEGLASTNPKAHHGRSKEKRSDCPLVTLGLVLDAHGFVRRSQTFDGNVAEGSTLAEMLSGLGAPQGALVVMDAGIATQANIDWLIAHGYRYLVVRRGGTRQFDADAAVAIESACGQTVRLHKEISEDGKEVLLHCHSSGRQAKEEAIATKKEQRFIAGLKKIADGLIKPRSEKRYDKLCERIGRLREKSGGIGQHYETMLSTDASGKTVTALTWDKKPVNGTIATHPGVYCLRSSEVDWDEARLWRTYTMLTDLESVFRSLKSELGMRPVYHSKEVRCDGHLFITVLAYQCVQVVRQQLREKGIDNSWASLRQTLSIQRRVTTSLRCRDGHTLNIRKSTCAEPALKKMYQALGVNSSPGGTKKMLA